MLPNWSELHPLVIHFPIALLLVAPIFIVLSLFNRVSGRAFTASAFILMVIGTIGTIVAAQTGEAADTAIPEAFEALVERHEHLAETAEFIFIGLTVFFGLLSFLPTLLQRTLPHPAWIGLNLVFLVGYLVGGGYLVAAAHAGGALTHGPGAPLARVRPPADEASVKASKSAPNDETTDSAAAKSAFEERKTAGDDDGD
jgi:uncharacterized membrane protein